MRFTINYSLNGLQFSKCTSGHGSIGNIKKGSWFKKSVTIGGKCLNQGSLIDYLKNQPNCQHLKKGWFFGLGGSNKQVITKAFNRLFPTPHSSKAAKIYSIGVIYEKGYGIPCNLSKAAQYYQLAADLGYKNAQYAMAEFYENGIGVNKDLNLALKYSQLGAIQGQDNPVIRNLRKKVKPFQSQIPNSSSSCIIS